MRTTGIILAALTIAAGAFGTLSLVVLCFAGAPNSSPAQLRLIYRLMALAGVGGLICLVASIILIVYQHYWWAGIVGGLPVLVLIGLIVWVALS